MNISEFISEFIKVTPPTKVRNSMYSHPWVAQFGAIITTAKTKEEAIKGVMTAAKKAVSAADPEAIFGVRHYAVAYYATDSWAFWVSPIGDTKKHGVTLGYKSLEDALEAARRHIAQREKDEDEAQTHKGVGHV
jgi:hypothetical protein